MKVIIAGSRTINDYCIVAEAIKESGFEVTSVISGHAKSGVDPLGEEWAERNNKPLLRMPANWKRHGKAAGPIRNAEMGEIGDAAVIVWDGKSRGTANMMDVMKRQGKPFHVKIVAARQEDE